MPASVDAQELSEKFSRFGVVEFATVVKDDVSGESQCVGLVEMHDVAGALEAIKWLNFSSFEGQILSVNFFDPDKAAQ